MRIGLYAHGGSGNHGCEALVRSTIGLLGKHEFILLSEQPAEDSFYGLDRLAQIVPSQNDLPGKLGRLVYSLEMKLSHGDNVYWRWKYRDFGKKIDGLDLAFAIGGDNYCYRGFPERFSVQNRAFARKRIPIILWGCSIEKERLCPAIMEDLRLYRLIVTRESITFKALQDAGLDNVVLMPDAAFLLGVKDTPLPGGFIVGNMVGLNVSPLVIRQEPESGSVLRNCRKLIDYILEQTAMGVVLIPHVVWNDNDDRVPLSCLYDEYASSGRVLMMNDADAPTMKGIIRQCRFLVAARTHASIAGYSTGVPTLVMGYSVKSRGIATDLFGSDNHYVLPVRKMMEGNELTDAFQWLMLNEERIRAVYDSTMEGYLSSYDRAVLDGRL